MTNTKKGCIEAKNIDFSNCNYDMALYFVSNYKHHFLASFTEFS